MAKKTRRDSSTPTDSKSTSDAEHEVVARDDAAAAPDALGDALRAAANAPDHDDAWDVAEELAGTLQRAEELAVVYRTVLARADVAPATALHLGQRAVRFHDEWLEAPDGLVPVLARVLEIDPDADWAFHRLSLLFTVAERWDDLLAFYDRALTRAVDNARRMSLLDEAAHVAKDFAGQADRAIAYLEQLFPLKPQDAQLATSLERLFERQGRYQDLIKLWTARLAVIPREAVPATRARIAACWLDHLDGPAQALEVVEQLLADKGDEAVACGLLERIAHAPAASGEVRRGALARLRERYTAQQRVGDVVRVLAVALSFAERHERAALHREIAALLLSQGQHVEALEHQAALVVLEPADPDARARLRELAEQTGHHDAYASALARAADAADGDGALGVEMLVEAARVRCDVLHDEAGGIELHARIVRSTHADAATVLASARRLAGLLESAGRLEQQREALEQLATLEPDAADRRTVLGRAARLADQLGALDRALASWTRRLDADAQDSEALDAVVDLLERTAQWQPLVDALRRRAGLSHESSRTREDLVRVAHTQADRLGDVPGAIATWGTVRETFGQDAEVVDALGALFTTAGRWSELAQLLGSAADVERHDGRRRAELRTRLGDVQREHLDAARDAVESYRTALTDDARNDAARAGLVALLGVPSCAHDAVETLASAYAHADEWPALLGLLDRRLALAPDDARRTLLLREAADMHEQTARDPDAALDALRRAMALSPEDESIEVAAHRLAGETARWDVMAAAYGAAIAAGPSPARASRLQSALGAVLEDRLGETHQALDAYRAAQALDPTSLAAADAVVRTAGRTADWRRGAEAVVASVQARGTVESSLVERIETVADNEGAWIDLAASWERAIAQGGAGLAGPLVRDLETRLAVWHRDRLGDAPQAEAALLRAVGHDRSDAATLRMLRDLQRRDPSRALVDTLLALADADGADLSALHEAAEVSLDALHDRGERSRTILARLLDAASERWTAAPDASHSPAEHAAWALERLVELHTRAGEHADAVALLERGAKLPFAPSASRAMRHRAATIASDALSDPERAIGLYRGILDEASDDPHAIERLAALYESRGRHTDLLALRRHELALPIELPRRLAIRLDIARVLGMLGERDARVAALRENLDEEPGHEGSVDELATLLEAEGHHAELADALADQATRLEARGDHAHAARLYDRVADIAEARLADVDRALAAHGRAVALAPNAASLDALARLHTARGEHALAVGWLEQRLALGAPSEHVATVAQLARAHVGAGQRERAVTVLETALADRPDASGLRTLLAELYRGASAWEPLARVLNEGAEHSSEPAAALAQLREAGEIRLRRLDDAAGAVPILERAVALAPQDRGVRTALADALRAAGQLPEARAMLESLVEEFGRRRPPERAAVHFTLAQIARASGDAAEALAQLETASSMDMGHAGILRMLGEVSRELGQHERAERSYRALLMIVRRTPPADNASPDAVGPSEVQFELSRIAEQLGQDDRAREMLESAFEAASQSEGEARRFERALRAAGKRELLDRVLRARLDRTTDPAQRAGVLADLSDELAELGRTEEALSARLEALAFAPASAAIFDRTFALAEGASALPRFAEALDALAHKARDAGDAARACELWVRLGVLTEERLGGAEPAVAIYERAEATGEQTLPVWQALDRLYGGLGNAAGQARVLKRLVDVDEELVGAEARTESLFRLASIELLLEATRDDGVEMMAWALDREARWEQAADVLQRAAALAPAHEKLLGLYERVARNSGSETTLLDALERLAGVPDAAADLFREAVDLAARLEQPARAEALLVRAIESARAAGSLAEAIWALTALAARRREAGDARGAITWLSEAATVAEAGESFPLWLEVAQLAAGPAADLELAASTYDRLREREPGDRNVWEPLLGIYRRMGAEDRLEALIAATIESVFDSQERNVLRMERARLLLSRGRRDDAVAGLRDVLDEDPDHVDAGRTLAELFEKEGRDDELSDLLVRQLDGARNRRDADTIGHLSLRLGALHERGGRRDEAMEIYRSAAAHATKNRDVMLAFVRLHRPEDDAADRADAMEKLLALESGGDAAKLAADLAALREQLGDASGTERALDLGFRANPKDTALRERLERWYTEREDFARLADVMVFDAEARDDARQKVARLRAAAAIHRERLGNAAAAAEVLGRARRVLPDDAALLTEQARCLAEAGDSATAIEQVSAALEHGTHTAAQRAELLRLRAEIRMALGAGAEAVEDLEQAYALAGETLADELCAGLDRQREHAQQRNDRVLERAMTLRLNDVLTASGHGERGHQLLTAWVERAPADVDVIRALIVADRAAESWDAVARNLRKLVSAETGAAKIEAALELAEASDKAGRPADAREGLEAVYRESPSDDRLRDRLRKLYERTNANRELAMLTLEDARAAPNDTARYEKLRAAADVLLHKLADHDAATAPLEEALRIRAGDHEATLLLADAYIAANRITDATALLEAAMTPHKGRRSRELAALQHRMARAAAMAGDRNVEMAWLNVALDCDMQNGMVASELADVAMELQQWDAALKALRAVTLMKSPGPMTRALAFLRQGQIAFHQGDPRRAVFLAKKAQAEDPALGEANTFLKEIGSE